MTRTGWRPRGWSGWALALLAWLLVVPTATMAFYMLDPIDYDGIGRLGWVGFLFPLQLLPATVAAAALATLAWRRRIPVATTGFVLIAAVTAGLALWPRWLNGLGYEVFDVEYELPPPARWQDEVGDVKCALGWVERHAAEYHLDPGRVSVMGYSAGGNLAMLAAYTMGDARLPASCNVAPVAVRSVVNLYGPADLTLLYRSSGSRDYIDNALRKYVGGSPSEFPARYRNLSPVSHVVRRRRRRSRCSARATGSSRPIRPAFWIWRSRGLASRTPRTCSRPPTTAST